MGVNHILIILFLFKILANRVFLWIFLNFSNGVITAIMQTKKKKEIELQLLIFGSFTTFDLRNGSFLINIKLFQTSVPHTVSFIQNSKYLFFSFFHT